MRTYGRVHLHEIIVISDKEFAEIIVISDKEFAEIIASRGRG